MAKIFEQSMNYYLSLMSDPPNCTVDLGTDDMPGDIFTQEQRLHGAILLHIFCGVYCFALLAIVCNDFFLPAVECIIQALNLSQDVGAATFMSIATSAPEFFVNLVGVFISKNDVGLGTIVGSSAFNLLGVGALGSLAAIRPIPIKWYPLSRDCCIYALCVSVLIGIVWDNKVYWYEALVLVILYISYFIFMFSNKKIVKFAKRIATKLAKPKDDTKEPVTITVQVTAPDSTPKKLSLDSDDSLCSVKEYKRTIEFKIMDYGIFRYYDTENDILSYSETDSSPRVSRKLSCLTDATVEDEEFISLWRAPTKSKWLLLWWIVTWPIRLVLTLTLPDCRKYPRIFPLTFLMCIVWIGINSYIITWMMSIIGTTFGVPVVVMGLTFLAAGGCLPEATSIIIVARKGQGGMGVSNALGANTMDILMCLGLLWFIKSIQEAINGVGYYYLQSSGMSYIIICLLLGVLVLFTTFACNNFMMCKRVGILLISSYLIFITFAILVTGRIIKLGSSLC